MMRSDALHARPPLSPCPPCSGSPGARPRSPEPAPNGSPFCCRLPRPGARAAAKWIAPATPIRPSSRSSIDGFVPVRVDADRRPDIGERYSLGGWPTTAFLTPDGRLVGGGTFVAARSHGRRACAGRRGVCDARGRDDGARQPRWHATRRRRSPARRSDGLLTRVFSSFDAEHGGFGGDAEVPLYVAPLHLALDLCRENGDLTRMADRWPPRSTPWAGVRCTTTWTAGSSATPTTRDWQAAARREAARRQRGAAARLSRRVGDIRHRALPSARPTSCVTCRPGSRIRPTAGGRGSQQADPDYYARSPAEERARCRPRRASIDRSTQAGTAPLVSAAFRAARRVRRSGPARRSRCNRSSACC